MSKKIEMADIVRALEKVRGGPVLTSNQCHDLAQALNAAAPVVERQELVDREQWWTDTPDGDAALVTRVHPAEQDGYKYRLKGKDRAWTYAKNKPEFEQEFDIQSLYTSPPAPVAVVLPEYRAVNEGDSDADQNSDHGWNACLDKVKEMNR